jgi:hypothetical protein
MAGRRLTTPPAGFEKEMTMGMAGVSERLTTEQRCCLHLWDLCRAYPDYPARPHALAFLEEFRARGAEARRQAELVRAVTARTPLEAARRRLIKIIGARGGLAWRSKLYRARWQA